MFKKILMKTLLILIAVVCLSIDGWAAQDKPLELHDGLSLLSKQLLAKRTNIGRRKIAVTDLTSLYGEKGNLGAFIAEEMTSLLASQGAELLERRLLDESLKELRLNMTDLVDPKSAKRLGHLTGTELLLLGTITEFEDTIKINARLIDIETLNIVSVGDVLIKKDKHVLKLMGIPYPGNLFINTTGGSKVYLDGTPVGQTNMWGDLRLDKIKPGSHSITVEQEGYRTASQSVYLEEDQELKVNISLVKLPSPGVAVFLSMIFPGGGDIYLGHSDWWLYTLGISGSVYGAVYYSRRTEDLVWVQDENGKQHIEKRGKDSMYAFAALAAVIWGYDLVHVSSSAKNARYTFDVQQNTNGFKVGPESKGAMVVYRWTW